MASKTIPPLAAVAKPTTFIQPMRLNKRIGVNVMLASETFQLTGSFKFRAAYNLAANVPNDHIITASSGNFGQALAYACSLLGKRCTVVMPDNSAQVKVDAVREFGARVELVQTSSKSRAERVAELADEFPDAFIASAYDDRFVIEGNASLGKELAAFQPAFDAVLVPVGGGGLSSGIIQGLKQAGGDRIKVYGVEPALADDASRSLAEGAIVANEQEPQTIADGARTVSLGKLNFEILKAGLSGIITVPEETIAEAVRSLFLLANLKAEPTGAVALAGAMTSPELFRGQNICCVVSGGNVDPAVFQEILQALTR